MTLRFLRVQLRLGVVLGLVLAAQAATAQSVTLASAQLGATGRFGGNSITTAQFTGWRFQTDVPLAVEQVGGHLLAFEPGGIFAAIVTLDSITSLPAGAPFTPDEVLATTVFQPPLPSAEVLTPLSVGLRPGAYLLIYGTGLFGASGAGALPNNDDQPDIPPTDISSFIFWGIPRPGAPQEWRQNLASHMRFLVQGDEVPQGDLNFDGVVNLVDVQIVGLDWQQSGPRVRGDANYDGVVNLVDVQVVGQNWTQSATAVPEPASGVLALGGLAAIACARLACGQGRAAGARRSRRA